MISLGRIDLSDPGNGELRVEVVKVLDHPGQIFNSRIECLTMGA